MVANFGRMSETKRVLEKVLFRARQVLPRRRSANMYKKATSWETKDSEKENSHPTASLDDKVALQYVH